MLLPKEQLTPALDRLTFDLLTACFTGLELPAVPNEHPDAHCPQCARTMECYGYMGMRKVMIDGCHACDLLWVDALELAAMARLRQQSDRHVQQHRLARADSDIVTVHMMVAAIQSAFLMGFTLG